MLEGAIPHFFNNLTKEQRFLLALKSEVFTLSDIMKIGIPQVNFSASNVCNRTGYVANTTLQVLAGLVASVAAAQIGDRLGFNPLDGIFHQDVMALDKADSTPYVPALLLGGAFVLSKVGNHIEQLTGSLANRMSAKAVKAD